MGSSRFAIALASALLLGGCAANATSARAPQRAPDPPLALAGPWSTSFSYSLHDVKNCLVSDGLAVLKNPSNTTLQVTGLETDVSGVPSSASVRIAYEALAVPRGATPGELSGVGSLTRLGAGHALPSAAGALFKPVASSGLWYVVIAKVHVVRALTHGWSIDGLRIRYESRGHVHTVFFPQNVTLPSVAPCGPAASLS